MLTTGQIAEQIGISPERVRGLIRARRIRARDLSPTDRPRYGVQPADLAAFMEASIVGNRRAKPDGAAVDERPARRKAREPAAEALEFMDKALARRTGRRAKDQP